MVGPPLSAALLFGSRAGERAHVCCSHSFLPPHNLFIPDYKSQRMSLNLPDTWVKAAVEHVVVQLLYRTPEGEIISREVEPDAIAFDGDDVTSLAGYAHTDRALLQCFRPEQILDLAPTGRRFRPPSGGRWEELRLLYRSRELAGRDW